MDVFLEFKGNEILTGAGKITHEQAKLHAETEFEKYRIVQDRLFKSDFDRFIELEAIAHKHTEKKSGKSNSKEIDDEC